MQANMQHFLQAIGVEKKKLLNPVRPPYSVFTVIDENGQPADFVSLYFRPGSSERKTKYIFELS